MCINYDVFAIYILGQNVIKDMGNSVTLQLWALSAKVG